MQLAGANDGEARSRKTGDGRRETGDGRRETEDGRRETGDGITTDGLNHREHRGHRERGHNRRWSQIATSVTALTHHGKKCGPRYNPTVSRRS
jgi:hypothetical protein